MDKEEAIESLETIRTILERSSTFTHISSGSLFLGGGTALTAALFSWVLGWSPQAAPLPFLALWGLAFLSALALGLGASARRAQRIGELFWGRKLQFAFSGFAPSLIASTLITVILAETGRLDLCPGIWMLLYGVGILSVGVVLDWEFRAAAWVFLVFGAVSLYLLRDSPFFTLGAAFGGVHAILGFVRLFRESVYSCSNTQRKLRSFKA